MKRQGFTSANRDEFTVIVVQGRGMSESIPAPVPVPASPLFSATAAALAALLLSPKLCTERFTLPFPASAFAGLFLGTSQLVTFAQLSGSDLRLLLFPNVAGVVFVVVVVALLGVDLGGLLFPTGTGDESEFEDCNHGFPAMSEKFNRLMSIAVGAV